MMIALAFIMFVSGAATAWLVGAMRRGRGGAMLADRSKASVFIGRWQPLHNGHEALIRTVLDKGKKVLVLMRPGGSDADNPHDDEARLRMFRRRFGPEMDMGRLTVMGLPVDINEVCHGRDVGWGVREIRLDSDTEAISARRIRRQRGLFSDG